jgi:hypothetical protein
MCEATDISFLKLFSLKKECLVTVCFMLVSCLVYALTLKMEETCPSKKSVDFQWTAQRYIPEDRSLHCSRLLSLSTLLIQSYYFIVTFGSIKRRGNIKVVGAEAKI